MNLLKKVVKFILLAFVLSIFFVPLKSEASDGPVIIVGDDIDYPPYSFLNEEGEPDGFNIHLAKAVLETMGYHVVVKLDYWDNVRNALDEGEIDIISGMFFSEERSQLYDFSIKHSVTSGEIFTNSNLSVQSVKDLEGKTVVVQRGDIVGEYIESLGLNIQMIRVNTVKEAINLVDKGSYDYAAVLALPGMYHVRANNLTNVKAQGLILHPNDYAMAVRKGNTQLILAVNGGLKLIQSTGEYEAIYDEWLGIYEERQLVDFWGTYKYSVYAVTIFVCFLLAANVVLKRTVNKQVKAIKASEKYLQNVLNALPDTVFILSSNGVFKECRHHPKNKLYLEPEDFLGKSMLDVLPVKVARMGLDHIDKAIKTENIQTFEYELMMDEHARYYEMRMVKLSDEDVLGILRDVTDEKAHKNEIEYLSNHDQLTGLYNRRFMEQMLSELDQPKYYPLGIIMLDVNGLKLINDSFGHKVGDELLVKVSQILLRVKKNDEFVVRIGGDEFVVIIPCLSEVKIDNWMKELMEQIDKEHIHSLKISVSYGWDAKYNARERITEVFSNAETRMYKQKLRDSPSVRGQTIETIIKVLIKDNEREKHHSDNVSKWSKRLAECLKLENNEIIAIEQLGRLHDIGKIALNKDVLCKADDLSAEELSDLQKHAEIGYRILSASNHTAEIADFVLYHHENWDGSGYPMGLKGEAIPLQSRIIRLVDAYDQMISPFTYLKNKLTFEEAINEMRRCSGTAFDPELVELFIEQILES